jgi:hypothetical protein
MAWNGVTPISLPARIFTSALAPSVTSGNMPDFAIVWPMKLIWLSDRFSRSSGRLEGLRAWGVSDEVEVADGWTAGGCGFSSGAGSGV